jgi:2',3'-cyclic-nucleotide 2'-phosphodiesterase (5'-nucleotidase family)
MQPDAQNATTSPSGPLEWGQINFLHTTDTHGWLEGHIKEQNYGADWGDYVSFTKHMKQKARKLGVDLLLVDTGVSLCPSQVLRRSQGAAHKVRVTIPQC